MGLSSEGAAAAQEPGGTKTPDIHRETDISIYIGKLLYCLLFKCVSSLPANIKAQEKCRKKEFNQKFKN
jgi:hypothetical protein